MQLDLHGKTWSETLPEFIELYNHAVRQQSGENLDIIHGYGSTGTGGILRQRIRGYLQRQGERLQFQPGEEVDGNQGHTVVVPIQPLLETTDLLLEQILEYCDSPRAQSKITGRFRRHGDPQVLQAIRTLEKQRRLRTVQRGRVKEYEAV